MTNTEAIEILENEKNNHINEGKGCFYVTRTEAVDMAINALTAIEDIKAEIEHLTCRQYEYKLMLDREEVFEIIDKYTGKEGE